MRDPIALTALHREPHGAEIRCHAQRHEPRVVRPDYFPALDSEPRRGNVVNALPLPECRPFEGSNRTKVVARLRRTRR